MASHETWVPPRPSPLMGDIRESIERMVIESGLPPYLIERELRRGERLLEQLDNISEREREFECEYNSFKKEMKEWEADKAFEANRNALIITWAIWCLMMFVKAPILVVCMIVLLVLKTSDFHKYLLHVMVVSFLPLLFDLLVSLIHLVTSFKFLIF